MPGYSNLTSGYLGMLQPYQNQRNMQFQANAANANSGGGGLWPSLFNLGTSVGTAYAFGPYGPMAKNYLQYAKKQGVY